jgi:hypothetical protein
MLPIDHMTDTEFEEFCFKLLGEAGFVNLDWRKGTGKPSSPSDSGRDIVGQRQVNDELDGSVHLETWFIDCKQYKRGVPPEKIAGLVSWAQAERPDVALVIASNFLSNPCKDWIKRHVEQNRPPFRIKYWERPVLEQMVDARPDFLHKLFREDMRLQPEVLAAEQEYFDRLWYFRSTGGEVGGPRDPIETYEPKLRARVVAARARIETLYGKDALEPLDAFDFGMISGKLSALRWVLGDEWDFLDT